MNKGLRIFTLLSVLIVAIHFILIVVYSYRDNLPVRLTLKADRYCIPLFHQNWKLFAPDLPKYNAELEYRIARGSEWTEWLDASASFGHEKTSRIETIEQGFNTSLGWQVMNNFYEKNGKVQFDRIVTSNAYASALFFVLKLEEKNHIGLPVDTIQLRLNFRFTPPPGRAYTFQRSTLEFPKYAPQR